MKLPFRTSISLDKKREALQQADFGKSAAEFDHTLSGTFVETPIWQGVIADRIDLVYGPKGSGKSAIAVLLGDRRQELRRRRNVVVVDAESPDTSDPVFVTLNDHPALTAAELTSLWKYYFLALLASTLRAVAPRDADALMVISAVEDAGILPREVAPTLERLLRSVLSYVTVQASADAHAGVPGTPIQAGASVGITIHDTLPATPSQTERRMYSIRELLLASGRALERAGVIVWFVLDRLDVAFAHDSALEGRALRALFNAVVSLSPKSYRFKFKIFLRPDIWERIAGELNAERAEPFSYASAIHGSHIRWDDDALRGLFVRRLVYPTVIRNLYHLNERKLAQNPREQEQFLGRVLPAIARANVGGSDSNAADTSAGYATFLWLLGQLRDGTGQVAPRQLVLLLDYAGASQASRIAAGSANLTGQQLFEWDVLIEALNDVSRFQLYQTLYAEYPKLYPTIQHLSGGPRHFASLAELEHRLQLPKGEAQQTIKLLAYLGVLAPAGGTRDTTTAWEIPPLYARALAIDLDQSPT